MAYAPVVIFAYKRPIHLKQTIEALQHNPLAEDTKLIIYSDFPQSDKENEAVNQVRQYIHSIKGFHSIEIIERNQNLGLANSIISGVTDVINRYGKAIVLEDDLITSPYFLSYMNQALDLYEHDSNVASIHAYVYPVNKVLPETFFLRGADCWGWGTWKRAWNTFETDGAKLLAKIDELGLKHDFNLDGGNDFYGMLKNQVLGKNQSWAVRWYASCYLNDMFTLYPGRSLVNNIGLDSSGTHCSSSNQGLMTELTHFIKLERIPITEDKEARAIISQFLKQQSRLKKWFQLLLGKICKKA